MNYTGWWPSSRRFDHECALNVAEPPQKSPDLTKNTTKRRCDERSIDARAWPSSMQLRRSPMIQNYANRQLICINSILPRVGVRDGSLEAWWSVYYSPLRSI